jgi:recombination protein RecT
MTEATTDARPGIAERATQAMEVRKAPTLTQMIEGQKGQIERSLPSHLKGNADAFLRAALTLVKTTKNLAQCEPVTVLGGLMTASALGLEFGPLGHCYLLPFKNNRTGKYEAQFILGYKGMIDLAWRSDRLRSIEAHEVKEHDEFEFAYGLEPVLIHKPKLDGPRGESICYYGVAHFKGGGYYFLVLSKSDVEDHRKKSKSKDRGPWVDDYDAMAKKTCIRAMAPFLPLTTEVLRDINLDGVVASTTADDEVDTVQVDFTDTGDDDVVDGEVVE